MPRPRTDRFWGQRVGELAEEHPQWGAGRIERELWRVAASAGRNDVPSLRQVGRLLRQHRSKDRSERATYQRFRWPESLEQGLLPWEASRALLDLMAWCRQAEQLPPTVREARRFWNVTLAAPDAPLGLRWAAAYTMDMLADDKGVRRAIEWILAHKLYTPREHYRRNDEAFNFVAHLATVANELGLFQTNARILHAHIHTVGAVSIWGSPRDWEGWKPPDEDPGLERLEENWRHPAGRE